MNKILTIQTALVSLLTLAALVLLCVVCVHWFWLWFAPPSEAPAPAAPFTSAGSLQTAYSMFGTVPQEAAQSGAQPGTSGLAIRLLGIIAAEDDGADYAIVQLEPGKSIAIHEGQEFAPGVRLIEVGTDYLVLERDGSKETIAWPQP